jgi:ABC-type multidrug transport system fused ATPase/permease subunit
MKFRQDEPNTARKLWYFLSPLQRRMAIALLGFMLIGMVLETLGVGLVIPALALMMQSDVGAKYPWLGPLLRSIGNPSSERLVVFGMLTLLGVYTVKAIFLAFLAWQKTRFVWSLQANLSERLFSGYLRQPYSFHLQRNSAQLTLNAINHTGEIAGIVHQALIVITEILVLCGISGLLLVVEPVGAAVVLSTLSLAGWGFHRVTSANISRWGAARLRHEESRIQHLQQGLGAAKDVILLGREDDFLAQYKLHNAGTAMVGQRHTTMQALPSLWLELLAVTGLVALVLTIVWQGKPVASLLPALGLFAAAAFRVMPSINRILAAVQGVRYSLPVINTLYGEFRLLDNGATAPQRGRAFPFKGTLTLDQIHFCYPSSDVEALCGVSISIPRGAAVGFIGGSGAGKSTVVDIVLGLLTPSRGTVKVDNLDIQANLRGWQDQIGYVPQAIYFTDDTLRRNIAFGLAADKIDDAAVWRAIRDAQLETFVRQLPQGLDTIVGERGIRLSGGQRQRIGIARALYHNPAVLVLDEATSSLDTATERGVMDAVRALKGEKTVLIVAHRLSTVEYCDRLFRIEKGLAVDEGKPLKVVSTN